jgi:hypothetical protein
VAPREKLDPVPQAVAGLVSMKCECGWECVFLVPEEQIILMQVVFAHLQGEHHLLFPKLECFWH